MASRKAAIKQPDETKTDMIVDMLRCRGGATYEEITDATGWKKVSVHAHVLYSR